MKHWEGVVRRRCIQATEVRHFRVISRAKQHRLRALVIRWLIAKPHAISTCTIAQKRNKKIVEVQEGKQKILTFACDLSRVVVTIYSFSSVFSPVPSINSSTLKNLSILATTRLDEFFDHTGIHKRSFTGIPARKDRRWLTA